MVRSVVMAKFVCVCGETLRISGDIPNPIQWNCLSEVQFDGLPDDASVTDAYLLATLMFRCPKSDHLWFFWEGIENDPQMYAPATWKGYRSPS
jgi:hypothetical protein